MFGRWFQIVLDFYLIKNLIQILDLELTKCRVTQPDSICQAQYIQTRFCNKKTTNLCRYQLKYGSSRSSNNIYFRCQANFASILNLVVSLRLYQKSYRLIDGVNNVGGNFAKHVPASTLSIDYKYETQLAARRLLMPLIGLSDRASFCILITIDLSFCACPTLTRLFFTVREQTQLGQSSSEENAYANGHSLCVDLIM